MSISTGARSQIGYVVESTYGVTPSTPSLIELPFVGFSVNLNREEYEDNSIRPDRMERYSLSGNRAVAGSIDVNFSQGVYDLMLESLMQNVFVANVLKTGVTRKSFSLEEAQLDVGTYRVYSGMIVDKAEIVVPSSGIVTGKFDVVAKDQSVLSGTSIDAGSGYTAAAARIPFTDSGAAGFLKEGGVDIGYVTNLTFMLDNGHAQNYAIGSDVVRDFTTSLAKVSGTATVFFEDVVMYNKFINSTASSLDVKLDNGTQTMQFFFPNIKYTGATKTITGNGPVSMTMPFKALYSAVDECNLVITRSA